jgi:hypothetical protein
VRAGRSVERAIVDDATEEADMTAKTSLLVIAEGHAGDRLRDARALDHDAARRLLDEILPGLAGALAVEPETTFAAALWPDARHVCAARFSGLDVICDRDLATIDPLQPPSTILAASRGRTVTLHATDATTGALVLAIWRDEALVRGLGVDDLDGIWVDVGDRLPFEAPFWREADERDGAPRRADEAGEEDEDDDVIAEADRPTFEALDFGDAALRALLGPPHEAANGVPLAAFVRTRT